MLFHWSSIAEIEVTILNFISIFPEKFEEKTFLLSFWQHNIERAVFEEAPGFKIFSWTDLFWEGGIFCTERVAFKINLSKVDIHKAYLKMLILA